MTPFRSLGVRSTTTPHSPPLGLVCEGDNSVFLIRDELLPALWAADVFPINALDICGRNRKSAEGADRIQGSVNPFEVNFVARHSFTSLENRELRSFIIRPVMIPSALSPLQSFDSWLRSYYQNKQTEELVADEEKKALRDLEAPDLDVSFRLVRNPLPPRRSDIPMLDVAVKNRGGVTNLMQASFRVYSPEYKTYEEKKNLPAIQMRKGEEQAFSLLVPPAIFQKIMLRHATLKFEYHHKFNGLDGKPEEHEHIYQYDPGKQEFVAE